MALWSRRTAAGGEKPPTGLPVARTRGGGCLSKILITTAVVLAGIAVWLAVMIQTAPSRPHQLPPAGEEPLTERSPRVVENVPPTEEPPPVIAEPTMPTPAPPDPPPAAPLGRLGWLAELCLRNLLLPVEGVPREQLHDNFDELRGGSRRHEAIDILAPRNTPVLAVDDGTVAKLFESVPGGLTIYQFDAEGRYCYYYAHLERYAKGLKAGDPLTRGEVIGYVGTSGNAPRDTPHLHFAIYRLGPDRRWWEGEALNPYPVLRGENHSTNRTGVPTSIKAASSWASQLVSRTQPCDSAWPTFEGSAVPCRP